MERAEKSYDYALYFEQDWKPTIQKMVAKDYNHPSVILYCVGDEISEAGSESGAETNRRLCNTFRELDPTRYTTNALNGLMAAGYRLRENNGGCDAKVPGTARSFRWRWRRQQCAEQFYEPDVRGKGSITLPPIRC